MASLETLIAQLGARTVLERERAATRLQELLAEPERQVEFEQTAASRASSLKSEAWEQRLGALTALGIALQHLKSESLARQAVQVALSLLIDVEVRVRLAAGDCLGEASKILGAQVWDAAKKAVLGIINSCWDRDALVVAEVAETKGAPSQDFVVDLLQSSYNRQKPGTGEMRHGTEGWQALETSFVLVPSGLAIVCGARLLEIIKASAVLHPSAMRKVVEGCGPLFEPHSTPQLRDLLYKACRHPNRFVRETSYHILGSLCSICAGPYLHEFGASVAECLQDGLSENWSQVRYAACVCARRFLLAAEGFQDEYFPAVLPHLCFNRYDSAEGVRYYSLDTWRLVAGDSGPLLVATHIDQVVTYYVRCAKTNNHTVREAACNCLAELFVKVDSNAVEPRLPKIQRTLFRCLKDDSWTVRDASATAYAKAVLAFPETCRPAVADVWPQWLGLLDDNVFSVRQHAAVALADVARAYGRDTIDQLLPLIRGRLLKAKEQPAESETDSFGFEATGGAAPATGEASGADLNGSTARDASQKDDQNAESLPESPQPAQVPVSRIAMSSRVQLPASDKLADASAHILETAKSDAEGPGIPGTRSAVPSTATPQTSSPRSFTDRVRSPRSPRQRLQEKRDEMFRQGSSLRAMPKDTGGIDYSCGCMDYSFRRDKEPWEAADGAVYLLTELAAVSPGDIPPLLPVLADTALLDHWPQARALQTTICRQLPEIMRKLGKRAFKPHIELFLEPLFRCLSCENQLCRAAAGACLGAFRDSLGPRIFAGRLNPQQEAAMASSSDVPPPAEDAEGLCRLFQRQEDCTAKLFSS